MTPDPNGLWQILASRVTAFLRADTPNPSEVWERFVGNEPDSVIDQKKDGITAVNGEFDGKRLVLQKGPGRVDWHVLPLDIKPEEDIKTIGRFPEDINTFWDLVGNWLDNIEGVNRLAIAPRLVIPVGDLAGGYRAIRKFIPGIELDPDNTDDFLFRVNRKRVVEFHGRAVTINRLCAWQVLKAEMGVVQVEGQGPARFVNPTGKAYFGCLLELDINSQPLTEGEMSEPLKKEIFSNLRIFAQEIAEQGDTV